MRSKPSLTDQTPAGEGLITVENGRITLGVALIAIALFVFTGSKFFTQSLHVLTGYSQAPNRLLSCALILNIALILLGWLRYRAMHAELQTRRESEEQAREMANTDPLTGCLNRRCFDHDIDQMIHRAEQRREAVAYVMIDLDNFKQLNDQHGHTAGDAVLIETARRISAHLPNNALLVRFGGDEFVCIVPIAAKQIAVLNRLAEKIIVAVTQPIYFQAEEIDLTLSVGIAHSAMPHRSGTESLAYRLLQMADLAMYCAKKSGRNRIVSYEQGMESDHFNRVKFEASLRKGIDQGEFIPFYQPLINLQTKQLIGFEMLARWQSPEHGAITPDVFIPLAEELGLIGALSENLLTQALIDARQWDASLMLSINVSPRQLADHQFAHKLLKQLLVGNFPPQRLDIEITESCLHDDLGAARNSVISLKNQGVKISLDDFGTGYSSLAQLQSLPFDHIKIDRSLVSTIDQNPEDAALLQLITTLGNDLGLPMTAEGIESEGVVAQLGQIGEFIGQGYLFGKPQNAAATLEFLRDRELLVGHNAKPSKTEIIANKKRIRAA